MSYQSGVLLGVGGGKGGVGKSMVSANLAVQFALAGAQVALVDLDFGAANLHTLLGLRSPDRGLADFLSTPRSSLKDYALPTDQSGLFLIPCSGLIPEMTALKHLHKIKLVRHLRSLPHDVVLVDLGAGSSSTVVDFFALADGGIVVTSPEPTSLVNSYEFLKNVIYRVLYRFFKDEPDVLLQVKLSTSGTSSCTLPQLQQRLQITHPTAAEHLKQLLADFRFFLVLNMVRSLSDMDAMERIVSLSQQFLDLPLQATGAIFHDERIPTSVHRMSPVSLSDSETLIAQGLKRIAHQILRQMLQKSHLPAPPFQLAQVMQQIKQDYPLALQDKYRWQRQQEKRWTPSSASV